MSKSVAVTPEAPVASTAVKPVVVETPKSRTVAGRRYRLIQSPTLSPKGKQRLIVLTILQNAKTPLLVSEVAKQATEMGLVAVGGVVASCQYHLHQMKLLGLVEEIMPAAEKVA